MSLFRISPTKNFVGPHQNQQVLKAGANLNNAKAVMIMIHGRGASAESILQLGTSLNHADKITFLAPQASNFAWYPYSFLAPQEQNQPGLNSGLQAIFDIIALVETQGFDMDKIFLLGFSQGACLASEFIARHPAKYAGLIALSGGLIGNNILSDNYSGNLEQTPVFMGCSDVDPHIPMQRLTETATIFEKINGSLTKRIYPGMGHLVNDDEIDHINQMLDARFIDLDIPEN